MPSDYESCERVGNHGPVEWPMDDAALKPRVKSKPRAAAANPVKTIGLMLLRSRHFRLTLWLAATLIYGTAAGTLLQREPMIAGVVMTAVWVAAIWGPLASRRRGHRRTRR
jgi:hypothetical protein